MPSKKLPIQKIVTSSLLYALVFAGAGFGIEGHDNDKRCGGEELWNLKVLTDNASSEIKDNHRVTSIKKIAEIITDTAKRRKGGRLSFEKEIVTIKNVFITKVILENDNDYHLVLKDSEGCTMIGEIVDPNCDDAQQAKDYIDDYENVRDMMDNLGNTYLNYKYEIKGVLFKDRAHGQTGRAANNLEIHPILKLKPTKKLTFN